MKSIAQTVRRHIPGFRYAGHWMEVVSVFPHQPFEQGGHDGLLGDAGDELRVQVDDFVADAAVEGLGAVAGGDDGFAFRTGGENGERCG